MADPPLVCFSRTGLLGPVSVLSFCGGGFHRVTVLLN